MKGKAPHVRSPVSEIFNDADQAKTRGEVLKAKGHLHEIYLEWYSLLAESIPNAGGHVIELGSGGGHLHHRIKGLISTDVLFYQGIDMRVDAVRMPIGAEQLRAITLINVLHHIARPSAFFFEASRCLSVGGVISMVEPWVTRWSRIVYELVGHERFDPEDPDWNFESAHPMNSSNQALPWNILERDRERFEVEFPDLEIVKIEPQTPFRYILSGGFSFPALMPGYSHAFWHAVEDRLNPWMSSLGLFAHIVIRKR